MPVAYKFQVLTFFSLARNSLQTYMVCADCWRDTWNQLQSDCWHGWMLINLTLTGDGYMSESL